MFTGLITDVGEIIARDTLPGGDLRITVACGYEAADITLGESIAVNGCCLTVVGCRMTDDEKHVSDIQFTLSPETMRVTAPRWQVGQKANLERALQVGDRLGGHMVTGHVDGLSRLTQLENQGDSHKLTFEIEEEIARYVARKGSVTLDGVSLTVNTVENRTFSVTLIPHTWQVTTLGTLKPGDVVNTEIDLIARYLERLQTQGT